MWQCGQLTTQPLKWPDSVYAPNERTVEPSPALTTQNSCTILGGDHDETIWLYSHLLPRTLNHPPPTKIQSWFRLVQLRDSDLVFPGSVAYICHVPPHLQNDSSFIVGQWFQWFSFQWDVLQNRKPLVFPSSTRRLHIMAGTSPPQNNYPLYPLSATENNSEDYQDIYNPASAGFFFAKECIFISFYWLNSLKWFYYKELAPSRSCWLGLYWKKKSIRFAHYKDQDLWSLWRSLEGVTWHRVAQM